MPNFITISIHKKWAFLQQKWKLKWKDYVAGRRTKKIATMKLKIFMFSPNVMVVGCLVSSLVIILRLSRILCFLLGRHKEAIEQKNKPTLRKQYSNKIKAYFKVLLLLFLLLLWFCLLLFLWEFFFHFVGFRLRFNTC